MSRSFRYRAFGLTIESMLELPELGSSQPIPGEPDLIIREGPVARHGTELGGEFDGVRWVDDQTFWFHAAEAAYYRVSDGREIVVMVNDDAEMLGVRGYLLGSVFGAMLLQRGFLVLHGNAIKVGDGCLVCVGQSGAGKSTLAAGFLRRGFSVLADDVVAVDSGGMAYPGFPRVKLWQDAADHLGISTQNQMRVFPGMDKFNMPIRNFDVGDPVAVSWIYELTRDQVDAISIARITGIERFRLLKENTYRGEYLSGPAMLYDHLKRCSELADKVHLGQVVRPREGFLLDDLVDALLENISAHQPGRQSG